MRPPDLPLSYCRPGIYGFLVLAFAPAVFAQSPPTLLVRQGDTWNYRKGTSGSNTDAIDIGPIGGVPSVDVMIEDCLMHNFRDKGVSIGDGPDDAENIIVRNCLMFDIARGVQVKHASVVKVQNCTIVDALIGLHGFEKSGATGGGIFTETYNTIVATSTEAVELETNSTFAISYWFFRFHGANFLGTSFNSEPVAAEKLTVDTDPRRILHIDSITLDSSREIQLYFAAQAVRSYIVEYSTTLQAGTWEKLADIPAETRARPVVVVSDTPPAATPKRFYGLITSP